MVIDFHGYVDARGLELFKKLWNDTGGAKAAENFVGGTQAALLEAEDVLEADDVLRHSGDFGEVRNASRAVTHARDLNDDGDCGGDLLADRFFGKVKVSHHCHGFHAGDGVTWTVGVDGCERTVVAGVHGLQHVERFFGTDLADDDAVGAHAKGVDDKFALFDSAATFDVDWAALESHNVMLLELKFSRVFDGDDAFGVGDKGGEHVEQRGLTGAGTTRDDNVETCLDGALEKLQHLRSDG